MRWSTRIYTLTVVLVILFSVFFNAWDTNWTMTIIAVIAALLFFETFAYAFAHHPTTWKTLRWILVLILAALLLTGYRIWA